MSAALAIAQPAQPEGVCPGCGSHGAQEPLVIGCHLLVLRVLEVLGKRIVRVPRSRYEALGDVPVEYAHTMWRARARDVDAVLDGAWRHVPALLAIYAPHDADATREVQQRLDRVVREVVAEQRPPHRADVRFALSVLVDERGR